MTTNADVYEQVTNRIITALEAGTVPWQQPWISGGFPVSMSSNKPYRGINVWLLLMAAAENGYCSPWWGTYKQITEHGGQVRKGEKSTLVILWKSFYPKGTDPTDPEAEQVWMLRTFRVFNAEQADGLPEKFYPAAETSADSHEIADAELTIKGYLDRDGAPSMHHDVNGQAFYNPASDEIHVPSMDGHRSPEHYYATMFHEMGHSTGHSSRLDRDGVSDSAAHFGSAKYASEELVAQMTSTMLCAITGTETEDVFDNSAAYIAGWLRKLSDDHKLIVKAATAAQAATELISGS